MQNNILLPALIFVPLIAGFLCWLVEKADEHLPRWIAFLGMLITFVLSLMLWHSGDFGQAMQSLPAIGARPTWLAEYRVPWVPSLGVSFHLAVDGLSLLMVALTAFLGMMAVACSWGEIQRRVGFFHLNLLWSLAGVIGVFLAIDLFLFFFFWEMMLVPIYFLIAIWGHNAINGKTKEYAATKFFIYTQASGLIMLIGILVLVMIHASTSGQLTFDYMDLLGTSLGGWEYPLMLLFFIGFAVKLPIFPLHGWLPDAHAQAPTAGSVDLAGILIKTAAYGLLRFVLPLFPNASAEFAPIAIILGTIGIFYGAWLAFMQTDMKRLLAYTSVSHMGFVVLAMYAGSLLSLQGLMIQMLAHGLSSAALFIMSGQLYERLHTRDLTKMGGLWGQLRYYPPLLMFFSAALLGIPATGNFIGEFLILLGAFSRHPVAVVLATFSLVWAGLYALILIYRALFGHTPDDLPVAHAPVDPMSTDDAKAITVVAAAESTTATVMQDTYSAAASNGVAHDTHHHTHMGTHGFVQRFANLSAREVAILLTLAIGLLWLGLYPQTFLDVSESSMRWIEQAYQPTATAADSAATLAGSTGATNEPFAHLEVR